MITELRTRLATTMDMGGEPRWPVYPFKPDDVNEVPCIVVSRPSITIDVQHHTVNLPVLVIGRRDGSHDAQSELDDVTSWAAQMIAGPEFAVTRIDPTTATVAEHTFPAYELSVSCGASYCKS